MSVRKQNALVALFGMVFVVALSILSGCTTDEDETRTTLENMGFTDVQPSDIALWGCGHGDKYGRNFKAKNPAGHYVNGTVCCGIIKSCTVRF
jgi:hypothetical protein